MAKRGECTNPPLEPSDPRYTRANTLRDRLAELAFQHARAPQIRHGIFLPPTDAYTAAFLRAVDPNVVKAVLAIFTRERAAIEGGRRLPLLRGNRPVVANQSPDAPGKIYCFHDARDESTILKVGRTRQRGNRRLRQWEATLEPDEGTQLVELFNVRTRYNVFAERVAHTVMMCENLTRVNPHTGQRLDEFFRVTNAMELKFFLILCVAYVDDWCDAVWANFRATSPLYARWRAVGEV